MEALMFQSSVLLSALRTQLLSKANIKPLHQKPKNQQQLNEQCSKGTLITKSFENSVCLIQESLVFQRNACTV